MTATNKSRPGRGLVFPGLRPDQLCHLDQLTQKPRRFALTFALLF